MRVLTFSRQFPVGHPKAGEKTYFVEKIWNGLINPQSSCDLQVMTSYPQWGNHEWWEMSKVYDVAPKHHTIRSGSRWRPGDMASLRVWSGLPYRSKQIEFAQVEVKKVWEVEIWMSDRITIGLPEIPGAQIRMLPLCDVAANDGLECRDFEDWFRIHPKKKEQHVFSGQIISWSDKIDYGTIEN